MTERKQFVYKSTLKSVYGLTDSWIKKLGKPDKTVPNPHYSNGPPASLYRIERVEMFIDANRDAWLKLQEKRAERSKAAQAVADKKRLETIEWARTVEIETYREWLPFNERELESKIVKQWETFRTVECGDYSVSDFTMSRNAKTAYLRHNHTNYEDLLNKLAGRIGGGDAYTIIRFRCDELAMSLFDEMRG